MQNSNIVATIDAKGLKCPMPVIKLQQAIRKTQTMDLVAIETTDTGAPEDVSKWAKVNKHKIVQIDETGTGHYILVQHSGLKDD